MSLSTHASFHAPLVLRSGGKRDRFIPFTIVLSLALASFWLISGAPTPPAAELGGGVLAVYGP
jgi:hypothetical protein